MFNRRQFVSAGLGGFAAYAAGSFVPAWAQNAPSLGTPVLPTPGLRRVKVGQVEVISLLDGVTRRPLNEEFVANAPLTDVKALLASQGLSTDFVDVPYTPFLVVAGQRRILMDTGLGEWGGPTTGKLLENLRAAGFGADAITTVTTSTACATARASTCSRMPRSWCRPLNTPTGWTKPAPPGPKPGV